MSGAPDRARPVEAVPAHPAHCVYTVKAFQILLLAGLALAYAVVLVAAFTRLR